MIGTRRVSAGPVSRVWSRPFASRPLPLLHRPSALQNNQSAVSIPYPLVTSLASAGFLETSYLTLSKLLDKPVACPTSGCDTVLDSDYAELFGIPLSLFGALVYGSVALLALSRWQQKVSDGSVAEQDNDTERSERTDTGLLVGCSLLAACSSVLVVLLATEFQGDICLWCYLSASLSFSLFGTVTWGMGQGLKKATAASAFLVGIAVLILGNSFGGSSSARQIEELQYYKPDIETTSSSQALDLADRLNKAGAQMYGAFWCSHCSEQKQAFGKEAMRSFPYVECFPNGWKKGVSVIQACEDAGVRAFPTWKINGKTIEGEMTFEAIEEALSSQ